MSGVNGTLSWTDACWGQAFDNYSDTDNCTQTITDSVTTSLDTFTVTDTHGINGSASWGTWNSTTSMQTQQFYDSDGSSFSATGTATSLGTNFSFYRSESQTDLLTWSASVNGQYWITGMIGDCEVMPTYGSQWLNGSVTSYSYNDTTSTTSQMTDTGDVTINTTLVEPFQQNESSSGTFGYQVTSPPTATVTEVSRTSSSGSGSTPTGVFDPYGNEDWVGEGFTVATALAGYLGSTNANNAIHLGTTPGQLNSSAGLAWGLGAKRIPAHVCRWRTGGRPGSKRRAGDRGSIRRLAGEHPLDLAPIRNRLPPAFAGV